MGLGAWTEVPSRNQVPEAGNRAVCVWSMRSPRVRGASRCLWACDAAEKAQGAGWGQNEEPWMPSEYYIVPRRSLSAKGIHALWATTTSLDPRDPGASAVGLSTFLLNVIKKKKSLQATGARELCEQRCDSIGALSRS